MAVPILGAPQLEAPAFTLRVHRQEGAGGFTIVEVIRDSDSVTVATLPFATQLWDQLFHTHDEDCRPGYEHNPQAPLCGPTRNPDGCACGCRQDAGGDFYCNLAPRPVAVPERDPEQIAGRDNI
jgi:hypothetical protein